MYITTTHYGYFEKDNKQVYGLFCGHLPADVTIIEEREVLNPEEGYILVNKVTGEELPAIYLKESDCEDNYTEKEIEDDYNEFD